MTKITILFKILSSGLKKSGIIYESNANYFVE